MKNNNFKHYYIDDTDTLNNRKEISFRFLSIDFKFTVADGVFSKNHVDQGSELLLKSALDDNLAGKVLDYGCGYGVIGIVLAKLDYEVVGIDVVSRAIKLSEINTKANQVNYQVEKINEDVSKYYNQFQSVLLNPPIRAGKVVIYQMFKNAYQFLVSGGVLYVVIRKSHGAKSAEKELATIFDKVSVIKKSKGYYIIKCNKD